MYMYVLSVSVFFIFQTWLLNKAINRVKNGFLRGFDISDLEEVNENEGDVEEGPLDEPLTGGKMKRRARWLFCWCLNTLLVCG